MSYDKIAEQILAVDTDGNWTPPWHRDGLTMPINHTTGAAYQGMNVIACWASAQIQGFGTQRWATYKQWSDGGHQVAKGSKGTALIFYKTLENEDGETRARIVRGFTVFNAQQIVGYVPAASPAFIDEAQRIAHVEHFVAAVPATVHERDSDAAYYQPADDTITMPIFPRFHEPEAYYSTLLHELSHWTGHATREDRKLDTRFGSDAYAMEEMVAELSSVFVAVDLGIKPDLTGSAAYIKNWHKRLKEDPAGFAHAVALASRAAKRLNQYSKETVDA
jgi:antirestriction protein ArdC